jgi:hypothetical protein
METIEDSENFLVPPATDFSESSYTPIPPKVAQTTPPPLPVSARQARTVAALTESPVQNYPKLRRTLAPMPTLEPTLSRAIETETEWRGAFLKKLRESYRISIEEMTGITKVTKNYLIALEEENYARLPAAVYIRGFVTQIAKVLKLPHEKVANAYLDRYHRAQKSA